MATETTRTPLDAYMGNRAAALALIERIHEAIENHEDAPVEEINWSHVGVMYQTRKTLQALADRLFSQGEYGPIAK